MPSLPLPPSPWPDDVLKEAIPEPWGSRALLLGTVRLCGVTASEGHESARRTGLYGLKHV